jgi:hypothetical protein
MDSIDQRPHLRSVSTKVLKHIRKLYIALHGTPLFNTTSRFQLCSRSSNVQTQDWPDDLITDNIEQQYRNNQYTVDDCRQCDAYDPI